MAEQEIGKVVHFFSKINVAVITLSTNLNVGDKVKIGYHGGEFEQTVDSMEVNHAKVQSGKAGEEVAIKTIQETHQNAKVFKIV